MKVLVFDYCLKVTGHRLPYAALVADSFPDEHEVVLCLPDTLRLHPQVQAYSKPSFSLDFFSVNGATLPLLRGLEAYRCMTRLVKQHQPDLVSIPTADGLAAVCGLANFINPFNVLRKPRIDICLMRGRQIFPQQRLKQISADIKWSLIRKGPWQRVLLIDPLEWLKTCDAVQQRIFPCPDPVPKQTHFDKIQARESLNLPTKGKIVTSVGVQHQRKGTDLLVEAFAAAELNPTDQLVLIGKINPSIAPLIAEAKQRPELKNRLIVRDEFVTEEEFQLAIIASDVVAVPYRDVNRPSGIVCRCMAWGRPMVMTNRGWLKWILETFAPGVGGDPDNVKEFSELLKVALDQGHTTQPLAATREFIDFNTEENFRETWKRGLTFDAQTEISSGSGPTLNAIRKLNTPKT